MKTVFSPLHSRRHVKTELDGGLLIEPHEKPSRAETILARVKDQALGDVLEPQEFGLEPVKRVHTADYVAFLETACERIQSFQPNALVVALGVDTFEEDPISFFKLTSGDYLTLGQRLAGPGLPTVFTMEGGYDVDAIGVNAVNVMQGFDRAAD